MATGRADTIPYGGVAVMNIEVGADQPFYFGNKDTDGSWRIVRSGDDLVIQRLVLGTWMTKSTISA